MFKSSQAPCRLGYCVCHTRRRCVCIVLMYRWQDNRNSFAMSASSNVVTLLLVERPAGRSLGQQWFYVRLCSV